MLYNLTHYKFVRSHSYPHCCGCNDGLIPFNNGEWVKFEEANEASLKNTQHLRAKIADLADYVESHNDISAGTWEYIVKSLRQLSAVQ